MRSNHVHTFGGGIAHSQQLSLDLDRPDKHNHDWESVVDDDRFVHTQGDDTRREAALLTEAIGDTWRVGLTKS